MLLLYGMSNHILFFKSALSSSVIACFHFEISSAWGSTSWGVFKESNWWGLLVPVFYRVCIGWLGRDEVENRSLFKGNTLCEGDEIEAAVVDEIGLERVWGTLKFEPLEGLADVDDTTREEEVIEDEEVIALIKFEGNMTPSKLEETGGEMDASVGLKSSKYVNVNSWKSMCRLI